MSNEIRCRYCKSTGLHLAMRRGYLRKDEDGKHVCVPACKTARLHGAQDTAGERQRAAEQAKLAAISKAIHEARGAVNALPPGATLDDAIDAAAGAFVRAADEAPREQP